MTAAMTASFDVSKAGKYPVVLSDALLGKSSNDTITSIRYNHKSSATTSSPGTLNLKPGSGSSDFELSYKDQSDRYEYAGSRTSGDGQYVLIFDKIKQHFVLHRVDSTFDMNLISAPWQQDAEELRSQYPQLDPQPKANPQPAPSKKTTKPAKSAAPRSVPAKAAPKRQKVEKPKKKVVKEPSPEPEADDDSDDGLTIEYPGGPPPDKYSFNNTPTFYRAPSEPSDIDEDEPEPEPKDQDVDMLQLPSPANHAGERSEEEIEQEEMDAELEAELEAAFEDEVDGQDSDESEEE